jgi:DNA polymerase-1
VRKAFVPRKDFCFVMVDFEQMEYRLMLDYADETDLIAKVLGGLDIHQATADMMSVVSPVSRDEAKTLNFMLLYGGGVAKLCMALYKPQSSEDDLKAIYGLKFMKDKMAAWIAQTLRLPVKQVCHDIEELRKARALRELYFAQLPNVQKFIKNVQKVAENRKHIFTWDGALLHYADDSFAYKAPNGLIQGGCARIVKRAMVELHKFLKDKKSRMLVQIHDELLFEVHKSELSIVPELTRIMSNVYPPKKLAMACSNDHSWKSWGEKVKGEPVDYGEET